MIYYSFPPIPYELQGPGFIPDLPERIRKGEYVLPFYADLPGMPEQERKVIFSLMGAHEGKTYIPLYKTYTEAGFDPDKDMLQANVLPPELAGRHMHWWAGMGPPQWREMAFGGGGGLVYDWDLRSTLEGLYGAGCQLSGGSDHAAAASTGRYAGRKAADYARNASKPVIERGQVDKVKARTYAPINRSSGIGWKELQAGLSRIMQDYCGEYRGEETLEMGLRWLESIKESEASRVYARNPHELMRTLECGSRMTVGEIVMNASLARRASSAVLDFKRLDYPQLDPPEWDKFISVRLENGEVKVGQRPSNYWLLPPYASTYKENYERHCGL
jgi:succinate dehydrogenase/fumarate reductase flavoprotein subunit